MKNLILAAGLAASMGAGACDGVYLSAHAGANFNLFANDSWQGDVPVSFAAGYKWSQHGRFQWDFKIVHDSNLDKGPPFNDDYETAREAAFIGFTYFPD